VAIGSFNKLGSINKIKRKESSRRGKKEGIMSYPTPQNNQPQGDSALPVLALVLAFIFPIAGAIIGHVALGQMNRGQIVATNRSLAKAGVILGWVFTGLTFLFIVFYVVVLVWLIDSGYDPYM
jgi:hypothetical protein